MWEILKDALLDAIKDSAITFAVIFVVYIIISFVETKLSALLEKRNKFSPLIGAAVGSIPQCGLVVVATDMYNKHHITMGTLIAVFIACSDEAVPIILSNFDKALYALPLLAIKLVYGFIIGFVVDVIFSKAKEHVHEHVHECDKENDEIHLGCCGHTIERKDENDAIHAHVLHPLIHSAKILIYIFSVNFILNVIIGYIGEDTLANFIQSSKYLSPLFATFVGLIPNCASSVVLTELYLFNGLSFGACLAGLCINAGLGIMFLFKKKDHLKENLIILGILFASSLLIGYAICLIFGF